MGNTHRDVGKTKKVIVQKVNSLENHSESIGSMN